MTSNSLALSAALWGRESDSETALRKYDKFEMAYIFCCCFNSYTRLHEQEQIILLVLMLNELKNNFWCDMKSIVRCIIMHRIMPPKFNFYNLLQFTTSPFVSPIPFASKCLYAWVRVCLRVSTFSHQVCLYGSQLLHGKQLTPLSGPINCQPLWPSLAPVVETLSVQSGSCYVTWHECVQFRLSSKK